MNLLHILTLLELRLRVPPNGLRYPLVGGTGQRRFGGTSLKPRNLPENAQSPTSRVHAVLGALWFTLSVGLETHAERVTSNLDLHQSFLGFFGYDLFIPK